MPANLPYIPSEILAYTDGINQARQTPAERKLDADTIALPDKMTPMKGAEDHPISEMETAAGEAHFITLQTQMLAREHKKKPVLALDIGTFTGSSAGALAKGMPYGGKVITCDVNDKYKPIAQAYWEAEGIADRIEHVIAPATETMQKLLDSGHKGKFDIVFIDADKTGYDAYYEKALELVRPGGMIMLDNMLWSGKVANPDDHEKNTDALRDLNAKIAQDARLETHVLLEGADGIMVVVKADPKRFTRKVEQSRETDPSAEINNSTAKRA